jgi:predicted permease
MAVVIAALLPVFLLIVLGFILKRSLLRLDTQWHGLERLTYYVLRNDGSGRRYPYPASMIV